MTKKDKAYLAEGLHRLCADLAAIATLFEQPEEATPKPTPAEDPPAAPAPEENTNQAPAPVPDPPTHGLFSMAYLDDSISTDIMRKVKRPAPKKGETGKDESDKALTVESLVYVFSCIEKEPLKWQAFIHLAADTGCRRGELCGIEWKDIDWKNGIITIRQNVQYTPGKGVYITSPKNGKKRPIDIGEDTMAILRQWKKEQALEYICPFIFSPEKSNQNKHRTDVEHKKREKPAQLEKNPMNPQSPTAYFRDLRTRYNIPNFHSHMLRHTSASISLTHGGDIASVSARLGHSDTAVTLRMYAHANEESIRQAGQAVRDALKAVSGNI